MSVTPELRKLVDEMAAQEAKEAICEEVDRLASARTRRVMDRIDAAAPRLDVDQDPRKWRKSTLVKIGYFVIATSLSPNAEYRAMEFVRQSLAK